MLNTVQIGDDLLDSAIQQSDLSSTADIVSREPENVKTLIDDMGRYTTARSSGTVVGTTNLDIKSEGTTLEMLSVVSEHDTFEVLQKWEGVVTKVGSDSFIAQLRDLSFDGEDEEAEFPLDEVSSGDMALVAPGAVFYWCVGYWDTRIGQRRRASEIRFRRLPAWSNRELSRAQKAAEQLSELLDWK